MKGKIALVTGANGGLGTFVTQALLDAGATVVGLSRKIGQSEFNSPNFTALPAELSTAVGAKTAVDSLRALAGWTFWSTPSVGLPEASPSMKLTMTLSSACST